MNGNLKSSFRSGHRSSNRAGSDHAKPQWTIGRQHDRHNAAVRMVNPASSSRMRTFVRHIFRNRFVRPPLLWIGTALGILWALPLTVFGLLLGLPVLVWHGHMQLIRGQTVALLVRGPLADFVLSRHPFGAMTAMALGHVVISEHQGLSSRVLVHELTHVRQAARWGIIFPIAYLASSAWAAIRGRDAYWHNRFEVAARKAEKHG